MNIGKAMKEIREERKLSSRDMATQLGITPSALWRIENGKVEPKWKTVRKFIAEAHLPVAYFYSRAMNLEDYICP